MVAARGEPGGEVHAGPVGDGQRQPHPLAVDDAGHRRHDGGQPGAGSVDPVEQVALHRACDLEPVDAVGRLVHGAAHHGAHVAGQVGDHAGHGVHAEVQPDHVAGVGGERVVPCGASHRPHLGARDLAGQPLGDQLRDDRLHRRPGQAGVLGERRERGRGGPAQDLDTAEGVAPAHVRDVPV